MEPIPGTGIYLLDYPASLDLLSYPCFSAYPGIVIQRIIMTQIDLKLRKRIHISKCPKHN